MTTYIPHLTLPSFIFEKPAASVLLPVALGTAVGYSTRPKETQNTYLALRQPPLRPPPWVFGPVWTMLYGAMGYAAFRAWSTAMNSFDAKKVLLAKQGATLYTIQLALNLIWMPLFFSLKRPIAATVDIVALTGVTGYLAYIWGQVDEVAAWSLAPYLGWLSFATYLSAGCGYLNNWDFESRERPITDKPKDTKFVDEKSDENKADPLERPYTISQDEGDLAEDPLSNIYVDPSIYAGLVEPDGVSHANYAFSNGQALQYNEDLVQRRVAESAHAEPWTRFGSSMNFSTISTLSQTVVAEQPNHINVQVDETDSGYASLNYQPLLCLQCGKAFKNKAEEKKHSSTHSRPFKCRVQSCTNTKGFATFNDLERHQKDIHLIKPKHGPQSYYRCVLPTCSKREKIWSRKDNFKAHISRMHKHIGMDVDQLVARSEMIPSPAEMQQLARAKSAQALNRSKGKQRANNQSKQATGPQYTEIEPQPEVSQAAIPLWQTNVPDYMDDMPNEAAEMVSTEVRSGSVANTLVPNMVLRYPNTLPVARYGYDGVSGRHNSADGNWDDVSDCSFAYSHESSAYGGGTSDFG
ncbi:TspO/MBR-related protein, partial [Aureobasidium melanogenum]